MFFRSSTSAKVMISGIPLHAHFDDIEPLLKPYGKVEDCTVVSSKDPNTQTVHITFENYEQAQRYFLFLFSLTGTKHRKSSSLYGYSLYRGMMTNSLSPLPTPHRASSGLNGTEFEGIKLQAEFVEKQQMRRNQRTRNQFQGGGGGGMSGGPGRQTDFPLRLLVQSEMVGAIIGRQGSTIRQITQQSRARVDVHRKENVGSLEKAITIYGNPENCTNACKRILEVMQLESNNTGKG